MFTIREAKELRILATLGEDLEEVVDEQFNLLLDKQHLEQRLQHVRQTFGDGIPGMLADAHMSLILAKIERDIALNRVVLVALQMPRVEA